jgi:hypothetical protein
MEEQKITDSEAFDLYGIKTDHGKMPNGELRFRLTAPDGNNYIRTVASSSGAWQEAHSHEQLQETYIVEKGWMALAEQTNGNLRVSVYWPNQVVTTKPNIPHNAYLPACAVIHTVKHGSGKEKDWEGQPELSAKTKSMSEKEILAQATKEQTPLDEKRLAPYIALYNNLDTLLWRIPAFLAVGTTVWIGFIGTVSSRTELSKIPPFIWASMLVLVGLIFFIGDYSMARIREHHTIAGNFLARIDSDPDGYFSRRLLTVQRAWPPPAPLVIRSTFKALGIVFLVAALIVAWRSEWIFP